MNHHEDDVPKWQVIAVTTTVFIACAAVGFGLFLVTRAHAFDSGQYEGVDPQIRSWFESVKSRNGVPCCSMADGHQTDFKVDGGGIYFVPIESEWVRVPPEAVITSQGNPNDRAIVWYVTQGQSSGKPHFFIRCFVPVGGV